MDTVTVRPMENADVDSVRQVTQAAFAGAEESTGVPEPPPLAPERARIRVAHPLATDPGGCWVGERKGQVVGAAIAIMREGLWGLSLLVVSPLYQSAGLGRELLARAADYGRSARGRIVLSSPDPRALAAYVGLGLDLRPAAVAAGVPRELELSGAVRPLAAGDEATIDDAGRAVRGATHLGDIASLAAVGHEALVLPGRGYVTSGRGSVSLLAARDPESAAELLRAALAGAGPEPIRVEWLTAAQQWAVRVCREAGLAFHLGWGAVLTGGEVGPLAPYLPNGVYL